MHLDFTGTDPQVLAAFNLATAGKPSHAWLTIGLVHYLLTEDPEIPLNGGVLRFAGKVGTGFSQRSASELRKRLDGVAAAGASFRRSAAAA